MTDDPTAPNDTTTRRPRRLWRAPTVALLVFAYLLALSACAIRQPTRGIAPYLSDVRADAAALRAHVEFLSTECAGRNPDDPDALARAAEYIREQLAQYAAAIRQPYPVQSMLCENIVATFGDSGPIVVVGAHYDVFGPYPGADDNASGVAGLIELARMLSSAKLHGRVQLVAYSTEEPPYFATSLMGSAVHARALRETGEAVRCMIALEMIGYFVEKQSYAVALFHAIYPSHGFYAAAIGGWRERKLARAMKRAFRGATTLPLYTYSGPAVPGVDFSDHRNYWAEGIPALMVTDTAFLRNPRYHTSADTPDTLDYTRMAGVVDGVYNFVLHLDRVPNP